MGGLIVERAWEAWFAESSQCFHLQEDCRGLRNANRTQCKPVCGACQHATQNQTPYAATHFLFEDQVGNLHTDATCGAVTGAMLEIRECKICKLR